MLRVWSVRISRWRWVCCLVPQRGLGSMIHHYGTCFIPIFFYSVGLQSCLSCPQGLQLMIDPLFIPSTILFPYFMISAKLFLATNIILIIILWLLGIDKVVFHLGFLHGRSGPSHLIPLYYGVVSEIFSRFLIQVLNVQPVRCIFYIKTKPIHKVCRHVHPLDPFLRVMLNKS